MIRTVDLRFKKFLTPFCVSPLFTHILTQLSVPMEFLYIRKKAVTFFKFCKRGLNINLRGIPYGSRLFLHSFKKLLI